MCGIMTKFKRADWQKEFYWGIRWKRSRNAYIATRVMEDGGMCEDCSIQLGKIVHHKEPLTASNWRDPLISFNHDNLAYLCQACHNQYDEKGVKNPRLDPGVVFDESGEIIRRTFNE